MDSINTNVDILDIVIENAVSIHFTALLKCLRVSKTYRDIVQKVWADKVESFVAPIYITKDGKCTKCRKKIAETDFATCNRCVSECVMITATDAKQLWYLTEEDLEELNVYETYQQKYRQYIRLFALKEVKDFSIIKWSPWGLVARRNKKNTMSKAMANRVEKVETMNLGLDKKGNKWALCVEPFLRNGQGGMKGVKEKLVAYDEFLQRVSEMEDTNVLSKCDFEELHRIYLNGDVIERDKVLRSMRQKITRMTQKAKRKTDLIERLEKVGLSLRADSRMSSEYLDGERDDLDFVVETMQEMNWLFKYSNYKSIMSNLIDEWKRDFRDSYGWHHGFHEILHEDLPDISHRAKMIAVMRTTKNALPSFMLKYKN